MSGAKCASYRVDPAVLAARRERAAAARRDAAAAMRRREAARLREAMRRRAAQDTRDGLVARISALETVQAARRKAERTDPWEWQFGSVSQSAGTDEIEAWNVEAAKALAQAESELAEIEQEERQQDVRDKIAAVASGRVAESIRRDATADATGTGEPREAESEMPVAEDARYREIDALIDRLPLDATVQERDLIDEQISGLVGTSGDEFDSRLVGVKAEIQRIERAVAGRAEKNRRAEQLLRSLDGLDGAEIVESRGLLQRVLAGETSLIDADVERVLSARAAATADFERRFVATKIEEALRVSGIEVGAGFATDVVNGEKAYAAARSSDEHAVEFQLREGLVDMRVVRASGVRDERRDTEAEIEFCKDVGRISSVLHDQGVDLALVSNEPPGTTAVEIVPRAHTALAARRRGRAKPRERRRKR